MMSQPINSPEPAPLETPKPQSLQPDVPVRKPTVPLPPLLAELWAAYGPASFGMLVAMLILGGMSAAGWLIWWLWTLWATK